MDHEELKKEIVEAVMDKLKKECIHLCSIKFLSILRKCTPEKLRQFSWDQLLSEWRSEAPLFYQFLETTAMSSSKLNEDVEQIPAVCLAGSILLRSRNIHMSAVQHILGLLLFHGNASKQVYSF